MNSSYTNFTVQWQATPDLPLTYNDSTGNDDCKHGLQQTDVSGVIIPDWNEHIADTDEVCTMSNVSYVYPCCEAVGIEARFTCVTVACLISGSRKDQWEECAVKLAARVDDEPPWPNCQPGSVINHNLEHGNKGARRVPALPLAMVVVLAAAAVGL